MPRAEHTEDRRPTFAEALSQRPANVNFWEHALSPAESARIACQSSIGAVNGVRIPCPEQAAFSQRAGFPSFHYHCTEHAAMFRKQHQGVEYVKP